MNKDLRLIVFAASTLFGCGKTADVGVVMTGSSALTASAQQTAEAEGGRADGLYLHVIETRMNISGAGSAGDADAGTLPIGAGDDDGEDGDDDSEGGGWVVVSTERRDV